MEWLDFYNIYVVGSVQILTGFCFFTKCLKRKVSYYFCLLFTALGLFLLNWISSDVIQMGIYALLLAGVGVFVYKESPSASVLYALVAEEIMQLCFGIANSLLLALSAWLFPLKAKGILPVTLLLEGMALAGSIFCFYTIYRYFSLKGEGKSKYALMVLAPVLLLFMMGGYISVSVYGNVSVLGSQEDAAGMVWLRLLVIQLLELASLLCILYAYKKLEESFHLSERLSLLEQEEDSLRRYVDEAKRRYEKTRSFRHDIKNHISIVKELLQKEKSKEALGYLEDMGKRTEELSFPCSTNNPVADILVGNKLGMAGNEGIDVSCSLALPNPCHIADIDLGIILSNALDNAICACRKMGREEKKYIRVSGKVQGDFILLEIENSFCGDIGFTPGTGLGNIKATAEKYHGSMKLETEGTDCRLSVLLIISRHGESIPQQSG